MYNNGKGNGRLQPRSPISQPQPMMPIEARIPGQPGNPCWYPPGTAYNPIGVPPWAQQPVQQPMIPTPVPSQPQIPIQPGVPTPTQPGIPVERPAICPPTGEGPPVIVDSRYLQGYLKENIGKFMRVDFLIGTTTLIDKAGELIDVGIDYIVLRPPESDDLDVCDLYSIKFVRIFL